MGIYKRGRYYYADFYRDQIRQRYPLGTTDKKEATKRYNELMRIERRHRKEKKKINWSQGAGSGPGGTFNPGRGQAPKLAMITPLKTFLEKFRAFINAAKAKETQYRYELAIRYLTQYKKIKYLEEISPFLIEQLKMDLIRKKKSPENINRLLQALKTMMRTAEKWNMIPFQNWGIVSKLKQKRGRIEFHTEEELQSMLAKAPGEWYRLIIKLGARAGLRRGEMAALRWEDINFEEGRIYIRANKTENFRMIPMSEDLREELMKFPRSSDGYVVPEIGDCPRNNRYFITSAYTQAMKRAGIKSHPHKLRHTFASHLVQKGVPIFTVSQLLGHKSVEMTEIYAHLAPDTLKGAIQALP